MTQEKPWLASYPDGVPHDLGDFEYQSLNQLFDQSFSAYPHRVAFKCMGKQLTYAQIDRLSQNLAAYFQSLGLSPGARIALMMPNILQYPVALVAVLRAGYVVVNVNPLYKPRELHHQLNNSEAEVLIVLENFAHVFEAIEESTSIKHVIVSSMGELMGLKGVLLNCIVRRVKRLVPYWNIPGAISFQEALRKGESLNWNPVLLGLDHIAFLQYTGGTTGVSKGAVLLHRNILANLKQIELWIEPGLRNKSIDQLIFICALPLSHIFALTACCLFGMKSGGLNILVPNPRDIDGFVKLLRRCRAFHIFPAVNTLFNALLNHPQFSKINFSSLLVSIGGGMAVQKAVAEKWLALTGKPIAEGYGLSETSPVVCCNTPLINSYTGHIGLPLPGTEIVIRNDLGESLSFGEVGEICIRGPQVMAAYWNSSEENQTSMTLDGYFKTGDLGCMDQYGYIKIVDRKKDMILVSGFNVYPNEVEDVIALLPGVLECSVVGVPDEYSGEVVKAFVIKKDPALTAHEIKAHCKAQLTNYKCPKHIEFREELPKNNVGKILRRNLRE
jgi:long-chain acyl-CoA synthetase